jgi:hypothetical protein
LFSDGTNNYIRETVSTDSDLDFSNSLERRGLAVVTVLIGVFNKTSGQPVAGVINQPFVKYSLKENRYQKIIISQRGSFQSKMMPFVF